MTTLVSATPTTRTRPTAARCSRQNIRVSDHSHNNDVGYDYRFGTGWAFGPQAVTISGDKVLIGWMDSREGGFDTDTQDIYLAKVDFDAPSTVPRSNIDQSGPGRAVGRAVGN